MSDARLRDAERDFAATGSLSDEAAVLRERLRVGLVTPKAIEIALNCLGYPAAFLVLGGENDTWEYWRPDRLPDELEGLSVDRNGERVPLGFLVAVAFAKEMAAMLHEARSDRLPVGAIDPYMRLARSLEGKRRQLDALQQHLGQTVQNNVDFERGPNGVDEVDVMYAIIVYAAQAFDAPAVHLRRIFHLFMRQSTIVGHNLVTRHYWARRMILCVLIPHLLGHASTVPHSDHLWQAKRRIPPERWRSHE